MPILVQIILANSKNKVGKESILGIMAIIAEILMGGRKRMKKGRREVLITIGAKGISKKRDQMKNFRRRRNRKKSNKRN